MSLHGDMHWMESLASLALEERGPLDVTAAGGARLSSTWSNFWQAHFNWVPWQVDMFLPTAPRTQKGGRHLHSVKVSFRALSYRQFFMDIRQPLYRGRAVKLTSSWVQQSRWTGANRDMADSDVVISVMLRPTSTCNEVNCNRYSHMQWLCRTSGTKCLHI